MTFEEDLKWGGVITLTQSDLEALIRSKYPQAQPPVPGFGKREFRFLSVDKNNECSELAVLRVEVSASKSSL
jgi:hypothetical protein